ncbi:uncharacterized protein LOC134403713 [Elgaria multicarinata webbii]|uniref:uncharacterized protein LOC134403713 n=1 Tax=Elgaria multicarinata webbii TaxID=159646 RepID=UPI002FCD6328
MNNLYAECGLLLLWGVFQSMEGAGKGKCPAPPTIDSAEYFAEWYALGTRVRYKCEEGYDRIPGRTNRLTCGNTSGRAMWIPHRNGPPTCIVHSTLTHPSSEQLPTEKWGDDSASPKTTAWPHPVKKDFCRAPQPIEHAAMEVTDYYVGQELKYKCLDDNGTRPALYGVSTCENDNEKVVWSALTLQCTNNTGATTQPLNTRAPAQPPNTGTTKHYLSAVAFSIAVMATIVIF